MLSTTETRKEAGEDEMMNSKPADTSPDTMDIVVPEDEVVSEAAEKIVADLKKFDDRTVGYFGASCDIGR